MRSRPSTSWLHDLLGVPPRRNLPTEHRAANGFFQWLVLEGEGRDNPLERIEPPRVPETLQAYYTVEDVQRVLKALNGGRLKGVDATPTRTSVLVLFDTSMRASEICALRTEEVNWDDQTIGPP